MFYAREHGWRPDVYGKLFSQMYNGTLATRGPWQALVAFQQMIILADKEGIVDMTAEALSRMTTVPLEVIEIGIAALEQPDPDSRSPDCEGRRIVRLADNRTWGWRIVNYGHYRTIRSQEDRREYMRTYQSNRRAAVNNDVNNVSNVNQSSKQKQKQKIKPTVFSVEKTSPGFQAFWQTYPNRGRRVNAKGCFKVWKAMGLEDAVDGILSGLAAWNRSAAWNDKSKDVVPLALTFLHQDRWLTPPPPPVDDFGRVD